VTLPVPPAPLKLRHYMAPYKIMFDYDNNNCYYYTLYAFSSVQLIYRVWQAAKLIMYFDVLEQNQYLPQSTSSRPN